MWQVPIIGYLVTKCHRRWWVEPSSNSLMEETGGGATHIHPQVTKETLVLVQWRFISVAGAARPRGGTTHCHTLPTWGCWASLSWLNFKSSKREYLLSFCRHFPTSLAIGTLVGWTEVWGGRVSVLQFLSPWGAALESSFFKSGFPVSYLFLTSVLSHHCSGITTHVVSCIVPWHILQEVFCFWAEVSQAQWSNFETRDLKTVWRKEASCWQSFRGSLPLCWDVKDSGKEGPLQLPRSATEVMPW